MENKKDSDLVQTGETTFHIYQVQVRAVKEAFNVEQLKMIVDQNWQSLILHPSYFPDGIPTRRLGYSREYSHYGVPFVVAEAARWWFIALMEANHLCFRFETRIIERKVVQTIDCRELGEVKEVDRLNEAHLLWDKPKKA